MKPGLRDVQNQERIRIALDLWLRNPIVRNSQWIKAGPTSVYMRKTPVVVAGRRWERGLVISNVGVKVQSQQRGHCRNILEWMSAQKVDILVAESVISDRMQEILKKNDWHQDTPVELHQWWKVPSCL